MAREDRIARLIEQGVTTARAGDRAQARQLLQEAARLAPDNEWVWLWMSATVEGIEAQRECLHQVLQINPNNGLARNGLRFLNQLRAGQEWRAADAPWILGADETAISGTSSRPCPRCGAQNPAWSYTCGRCGAVLQPVDIIETARTEALAKQRAATAPSVILSWGGAVALNSVHTFAPEVELASLSRSLYAVILGSAFLLLLQTVAALAGPLAERWSLLTLGQLGRAALLSGLWTLLASLVAWLAAAFLTLPVAALLGGRGKVKVHVHLVSVAVSSWLAVTALFGLLLWGIELGIGQAAVSLLPEARLMVTGVLALYALILLAQGVQTAHSMHGVLSLIVAGAAVAAAGACYLALGHNLAELWSAWQQVVMPLLSPLSL